MLIDTHPYLQPDRKHLCHRMHRQGQGLPEPQDRPRHGLQADDVGAGEMAKARRRQPPAGDRPGVEFKDGIKQLQAAA